MKNSYTLTDLDIKRKKGEYLLGLIKIDPLIFLNLTTSSNISENAKADIRRIKKETLDFNFYDNLHINDELPYPHLKIMFDGRIRGHEGRHRAYAAYLEGKDFYCHLLPHGDELTYKIKDDILAENGENYIPSVLKNQFDGIYEADDFKIIKIIKGNPVNRENIKNYKKSIRNLIGAHIEQIGENEKALLTAETEKERKQILAAISHSTIQIDYLLELWNDDSLKSNPNKLKGGRGDSLNIDDVDQEELRKGVLHEMEHTDDKYIALEIALDHLAEYSDYYTRLEKMEKKTKPKKKKKKKKKTS